jgi:hypothetical protein
LPTIGALPMLAFLFATPLAALAVAGAAASVPVVIHLLNRNRYRVVTWAAMRFLLAAQRKNTRRMRIEQLILLAVRTLMVLLLVLAMASVMPWAEAVWHSLFPDSVASGAMRSRRTHKILVIDGSFSMGLQAGDTSCFDRARAAAAEVAHDAGGGDGFSVILMASPPRRIVPEPSDDPRKVADEILALRLPHGNADLTATFNAVEDLLRQSPHKFEEKEVYFFTDLQRATWTARQAADPTAVLQKIRAQAHTVFVDVGQERVGNLAVTGLTLVDPFATTAGNTTFLATVHNYGREDRANVRLQFLVGRGRQTSADQPFDMHLVAEKFVSAPAGQPAEPVHFEYRFPAKGDYVVQVRLERDALPLDDVRSAVVSVKDTVPVMLVNGRPEPDPYSTATEWLKDALNPFPDDATPLSVPARPKVVSVSDFDDAGLGDLTPYDCVFLCDVKEFTAAEVRRLEAHLRGGGGVVFCLGPHVDLENYNRQLYRNGEGVLPARLLGRQEAPEKQTFTLYAEEDSYKQPPLDAFAADRDRGSLMLARFRQYVRAEMPLRGRARRVLSFMPDTPSADRPAGREPLPVNDPALVEWQRYRGRVLLLTTTVNMDWTTWPVSPSFPAMMQELLRFAVAGRLREQSVAVGEPLEEFLPFEMAGREVAIQTPEPGRPESTRIQDREDGSLLRWTDTDASGIYRATIAGDPHDHLFAVNVPTSTASQQAVESDPTRTNRDELKAAYPGWEFQIVSDARDVVHEGSLTADAESSGSGLGTVIAHGVLLTLLVLVFVEVVLAWRFGHYSAAHGTASPASARWDRVLATMAALLFAVCAFAGFTLVHAAWTGDFLGFMPDGFRRGIEVSLGIPAPAPGEGTRWRLEFTPYLWDALADPWLAGALALAGAVLVAAVYFREGPTVRAGYKLLLVGLRLCLVLLALAVLLPQLRLWFERQGWPDVAVIIDDSRSMSTADHYQDAPVQARAEQLAQVAGLSSAERLQLAQALLTRGDADWVTALLTGRQVKVHVYHCSGRAARIADVIDPSDPRERAAAVQRIRDLRAEGESSQLGTAVRQVLNDFRGSSLSAVIMLTDGVTTEGENLSQVARYASQAGVPLFFVGIGDAHEVRDLKLHDLQAEDSVYVYDHLIFDFRLTGQGYTDLAVPVTLKDKATGKVLDQKTVRVDPQGKPVKVRLTDTPTKPGERTYVIEVPVQPDEKDRADNNRLEHTVFVRESKLIKVLYVEGYARWEFRKVKWLLERESAIDPRNKTLDLKVLLLDPPDEDWASVDKSALAEFPSKLELNQYDVVIFGDVDPTDSKVAGRLPDVVEFVREHGGGFLMIAGERDSPYAYKDTPLRDILPIEIVQGEAPPERDRERGYRPELTPTGRFHPIFNFTREESGNASIWNGLPELYWWAEGYRAKWGAEVLAVHPTAPALPAPNGQPARETAGQAAHHPLALQQFVGSGRSMFLGFDETWRWGYREDELYFNKFWIQLMRYLSRNRHGRIELRLNQQTPYRRGERIRVTVRFPDDTPPPPPETVVKVIVERTLPQKGGRTEHETETLPLAKVEGSRATYGGELKRTPEGDYQFWLSSPVVPAPRPRAEAVVTAPPGEMAVLRMNQQELERAADETHGKFYTLADADRVLDDLPVGSRVALSTPQPPRLLWNHAAVFGLGLLLLGTEWVLRKRRHLL